MNEKLIKELYWVAGFLEGEGHFRCDNAPRANAVQLQEEPLKRLKHLVGGNIHKFKKRGQKNVYHRWQISGSRAVGLMFSIYQEMSPYRKSQIRNSLTLWRSMPPARRYRTHCARGHPYNKENTIVAKKNYRRCRTCVEWDSQAHWRLKKFKKYLI